MSHKNIRTVNLQQALRPALAHAETTVSSTAVKGPALTSTDTECVLVEIAGQDCRVTFDGATAPVGGSKGFLYKAGTRELWSQSQYAQAQFIRDGGSDGVLKTQAFRP